jgi:hypothetical protein
MLHTSKQKPAEYDAQLTSLIRAQLIATIVWNLEAGGIWLIVAPSELIGEREFSGGICSTPNPFFSTLNLHTFDAAPTDIVASVRTGRRG